MVQVSNFTIVDRLSLNIYHFGYTDVYPAEACPYFT